MVAGPTWSDPFRRHLACLFVSLDILTSVIVQNNTAEPTGWRTGIPSFTLSIDKSSLKEQLGNECAEHRILNHTGYHERHGAKFTAVQRHHS